MSAIAFCKSARTDGLADGEAMGLELGVDPGLGLKLGLGVGFGLKVCPKAMVPTRAESSKDRVTILFIFSSISQQVKSVWHFLHAH